MNSAALNKTLIEGIRTGSVTIQKLTQISQVHVFNDIDGASATLREGCVLLGVATVDNDKSADGFRVLVGLPRGTIMTGYLSNYFSGCIGERVD